MIIARSDASPSATRSACVSSSRLSKPATPCGSAATARAATIKGGAARPAAAAAAARAYLAWVSTTRGVQSPRMWASMSADVEGLTGQKTAPALSTAKIDSAASQILSINTTTRSPLLTPRAASPAASRSAPASSSA
ncbi:hypothetical protein [Nitratireductor alexandrii]|uniref:hypothetical protein n=1 Tax=Nitratireductor alexandrii TaxID=2448161 RepID=UPI0013DFAC50|nr:hypothetical protein [Nitratireductor alexandrii]